MNNSYKLVYSETLNTWVAVAEHVSARGKKSAVRLVTAAALLAGGAVGTGWALAAPPLIATPAVNQLPTGAQVATGTVNISQTQTATAANMAIQQSSNQAIVNWQSFNVGANAKVNITQPSSTSVLLNRVMDSNPSQIFGQVNANGQVFLSNPNGVYFAPGSSVDVGSFTATTHSISDADFLAGKYNFNRNGATGSITNEGSITSGLGGHIALLAPEVRNHGVVVAKLGGTVAMAAGESYQLQFNSNNQLTNVLVTPSTLDTLLENGNLVQAPGGLIILSAQAASSLLGGVVKNSGSISATGLVNDGGTIRLSASNKIELTSTSSISADAAPNSAGNGGRIDIITDLNNATGITKVDGSISAKGGELGGDGGFVDTSAARLAIGESTLVTTGASKGKAGTWLLDPYDVTIGPDSTISGTTYANSFTAGTTSTILASSISSSLNAGSNVSISTGSDSANTIYVNSAITATTGTATLSLTGGTINLAANISTVGSQTYSGAVVINNASGITLSSTNSNINFGSTVNSSTGNYYGLTVSNGTGTTAFGGVVGGTNPLGYLCINVISCSATSAGTASSSGTTTLAGNVTTSGTQTYGGNLTLGANTSLTSTANSGNGAVTIAGALNSSASVGAGILEFLGGGYWEVSVNGGSTWAYYSGSTYQSSITISGTTYTSTASSLASPLSITYSAGVYSWTPSTTTTASYLLVGGGGSGGYFGGGGGGGGGVVTGSATLSNASYAITVGNGGTGNQNNLIPGANGFSSSISGGTVNLTALGGGGGGTNNVTATGGASGGGGSGFGASPGTGSSSGNAGGAGGSGGTAGSAGASFATGGVFGGGGGGGESQSGNGGAGGAGVVNPITGSNIGQFSNGSYYVAGGGGGSTNGGGSVTAGNGGLGGGGAGSKGAGGTNGLANTGGGGGGTHYYTDGASGGSGVVVLAGDIVSAQGTFSLSINSGSGKASIAGSVSNVSTLTINSTSALSELTGAIGGSTALTKSGAGGTLTLSGANTYTGGTTISAGSLKIGHATALGGSGGAVSVADGAALDLNGTTLTNTNTLTLRGSGISGGGALTNSSSTAATYAGNIVLGSASSIGSAVGDITASGVVSGAFALTKVAAATLTLTGSNTYTGGTTISAGTLKVGHSNALGSSLGGAISVANLAALDLNGFGLSNISTLTLNGSGISSGGALTNSSTGTAISNPIVLASDASIGSSTGNINLSGVISGTGNLTKIGSFHSTLSGSNTYTGTTTVSGTGILSISNAQGLGDTASGTSVTNGATLDLKGVTVGAEAITLNGGTLATSTGTSSLSGSVTMNANSTVNVAGTQLTLSGAISGTGFGLTKAGSSTLVLSGTNTYSGGTSISAGTLQLGAGGTTGTIAGNVTNNATLAFNRSDDLTFAGIISGTGAVTKLAANTLTFSGANTYTGGTTISAGTLQIGAGSNIGSITGDVTNNATLAFNRNDAVSFSGAISGTGAVTKLGTGTTTLSGINTYTGSTTVSTGTLAISNAAGLGGTAAGTTVANGATLDLQGVAVGAEALTLNGGTLSTSTGTSSLAGTVTLGDNSTANVAGTQLTLSGVVSGVGYGLTKTGTGSLVLSGTNTYSGANNINAGSVKAASAAALGTGAVAIGSTGVLDLTYNGTVSLGSTLSMSSGAVITNSASTSNLSVSGTSSLVGNINTAGNQTYTGAVTLSGNTTLTTLNTSQVNTNGTITFGAAVDGTASGTQSLTVTSGTGAVSFGSSVGGTMPLSSLNITGGATSTGQTTTLGGSVTTSGNQSFGGNLTLGANASLTTTANSGNGAVTILGNVNTLTAPGTEKVIQFLDGGIYKVSSDAGTTWSTYTASSISSGGSGLSITYAGSTSGTLQAHNASGLAGVSSYTFINNTLSSFGYLLVGGGGGGASYHGGGGGGGGILSGSVTLSSATYTINVGKGGNGGDGSNASITNGQNGGPSAISGTSVSLTALGGGGGGGGNLSFSGGSGGGSGSVSGTQPGGLGTAGQGSNGGSGVSNGIGGNGASTAGLGGGGGGYGDNDGGNGGNGASKLLPGTTTYLTLAGGGGGGNGAGATSTGGNGGGGIGTLCAVQSCGAYPTNATLSGTVNTGGGGGGVGWGVGGNGGSGLAVISGTISDGPSAFSLTISSGTGVANIGGGVSNLTTLSINSKSTTTAVSGAIGGSTALNYNTAAGYSGSSGATGSLNLAGANTYTGGTTVTGGTLQAGSTTAFGGASSSITVNSGAALDLNGKTLANTNSLSLNGSGISGGGVLTNSSSTAATYVGAVTLASDSSIGSASGDMTVSGIVSGTGSLTKSGTDTLTLSGTNTFNGTTSITSGTLAISNASGLGGTSSGTTVASGATLDLRGAAVGAEAVTLSGGTLAATTGTSSLSGTVNLNSASSLSGAGTLTLSGAITSNGNGLALIGTGAKTLSSTSNTLSTIASGSGVGVLNVVNNAALAIGQVTAGGSTYNGINSTGTVSVTTRTGDLTVSQNVVTTSTATSYTTPAIKLGAGSLAAAGTPAGGDVLLSGTPSISVGTGGVALIYSGYATTSAARTLANSFAPKLSYYSINSDSTYVPTTFAAAYYTLFRESPTTLYTLYVPGQTFTYGTPITSLNYCYSTSASSCAPVTATGVPSTTQAQAFNNLLLDAGTYPGTIAPAPLEITGYFFAAGNAVNIVVNPKAVNIANVASTSTYDGLSTYTNVANAMTYNVSGLVGSDAVRSITQTPSNSVVAGNVANAGTFAVTPSAAVLSIGRASNYTFNYTSALATVSKANLTVKVKDDAKFVGESDNAAYDGVSYSGFVAGQTASVLSGAVAISRSNASVNGAGTYSGVLSAASSTLSSNNYNINYVSGNYTIVPADQLLIRLADTSTTYGTAPSYTLSSVQYKSSTGGAVVDLTSRAAVNTSAFTLADGAGGNTALTLGPLSSSLSSAGQVAVGSYQVGASSITNTSANYSNTVNIVGSLSVGQKSLTVAATSGLSKTYDGTTNMTGLGLGLTGLVGADAVSASGLGTYDNANAGNNKSFDVSGISLSGADAANYKLASNTLNASTGVITAAPLLITANNDSKTYDATAYTTTNAATAGVNYSGFVNGETASVLSGTLSYGGTAIGAVNVGNYAIAPTGQTSSNYAITYGNGALNISPADVRVSATNVTLTGTVAKVYDGTTVATLTSNNYVTTGWQGSDGATITQTTGTYDNANAGTNKLVNVTLASSDYSATNGTLLSNYNLPTAASGYVGVITPKSVTVSNSSRTTTYDGLSSYNALAAGTTFTVGAMVGSDTVSSISQTASGFSGGASGTAQAGTYTITPSAAVMGTGSASNYSFSYVSSTHTVNKATLNLAISKSYDGSTSFSNANTYTFTGMVNSESAPTISAGAATTSNADANSYSNFATNTLALSSGNYTLTGGTVAATITPKPVSVTNTARSTTYDGVTSYTTLATGTAYTVGPMVGSDGVASITQTPTGFSGASTGAAQAGNMTVTPSDAVLGTGTASNYSFSYVPSTHTVDKANLSVSATPSLTGNVYNGTAFTGTYTTTAVNGETFTVAGMASGTNAGTYTSALSVSGAALVNYNTPVITNANLVINPTPLSVTANNASKTYDGTVFSGGSGVTYSGFVNNETSAVLGGALAYAGTSQNAKNVGNYVITTNGLTSANYTVSFVDGSLTINPAGLNAIVASLTGSTSKVYDGNTAATLTPGNFAFSGFAAGEGASVSKTAGTFDNANAGSNKTVTVTLSSSDISANSGTLLSNYTLPTSASGTIGTISKAPLSVTASNSSKTYDGAVFSGGNGVTYSGFVNNETTASLSGTLGYAGSSQNAKNVGNYVITPNGLTSANYSVNFVDGSLTINPAGLNAIVASLTGSTSKVYDGNTSATLTSSNFAFSGFVAGEGASVSKTTGTYDNANAGSIKTVTVTLSSSDIAGNSGTLLSNYTLPTSASGAIGTISKAPLSVTASNSSKTYDGAVFSGGNGVTYSGFVNNETSAVLGGTLGYAGSSQNAKNVGNYVITPNGLNSANYTVSFVDGSLTITPAGLNAIVASLTGSTSKVYDGNTDATLTPGNFAFSGFVAGEGASVSKTTGTYDNANAGSNKTVTVTLSSSDIAANSGTLLSNYTLPTSASGAIGTISKAPLSAALTGNITKVYDGNANASLSASNYVISGFANAEGASVSQTNGSFTDKNAGTSKGVTTVISINDIAANNGTLLSNYTLPTSASGNIGTITPANLTLTALTNTKNFDGKNDALAVPTASGLIGSDTVTGLVEAYSDVNPGTRKTLSVQTGFQISDGNNGNNYKVTLVPDQTGEIRAQAVAVLPPAAVSASTTYAPPTLTVYAASGASTAAASAPAPAPAPAATPVSASASSSNTPASSSVVTGSSSGVVVSTINSPTTQVTGLVAVLVPAGTATAGTGLVIALPEQVLTTAAPNSAVQVTLPNNEPLPSWIRYDAATQTLVTTAVPSGAFPLSVVVTTGGQSTLIQISETTTSP